MAHDSKGGDVTSVFGSSVNFAAVTPSDTTTYVGVRAVYVGGTAGTIVATNAQGTDVTFNVGSGATLLISPAKIKAASTATGIVVLY